MDVQIEMNSRLPSTELRMRENLGLELTLGYPVQNWEWERSWDWKIPWQWCNVIGYNGLFICYWRMSESGSRSV